MSAQVVVIVPCEAEVLTIAKEAAARHLKLITDGKNTRLCSFVPEGWTVVGAREKKAPAEAECAGS